MIIFFQWYKIYSIPNENFFPQALRSFVSHNKI